MKSTTKHTKNTKKAQKCTTKRLPHVAKKKHETRHHDRDTPTLIDKDHKRVTMQSAAAAAFAKTDKGFHIKYRREGIATDGVKVQTFTRALPPPRRGNMQKTTMKEWVSRS